MDERVNRRQFLSINWGATIGFLGNFIGTQMEEERDFFRPPGAGDELDFLTSCNRCGKCKESCPEGIISLFALANGAKLLNTPYINPNERPCTFCQVCIDVCPTNALNLPNLREKQAIGKATIEKQICMTYKDVMCDYCVRSCPARGAISIIDGKPSVKDANCNGCGVCVANCISEIKGIRVNPI